MIGIAQHRKNIREQMGSFLFIQMMVQFGQETEADKNEDQAQAGDHEKRGTPTELIGQPQRERYAGYRGNRESRGNQTAGSRPSYIGNGIADHGLHQRAHDAAEYPGKAARHHQAHIVAGQTAGQR